MYIHIYILSKIFEAKIKYFSSYQLINIKGKYFSIFDDAKKVLPLLDFGLLRQWNVNKKKFRENIVWK